MSPGKILTALALAALAGCSRSAPEDVSPGAAAPATPAATSGIGETAMAAPAAIEPVKVTMDYLAQEDSIAPGATAAFQVTVSNNSAAPLGSGITYVTYHWLGEDQSIVSWENPRTSLPTAIGPGEQAAVSFPVVAPPRAGTYVLKVVMGQQDGLDFEASGQPGLHYKVTVR